MNFHLHHHRKLSQVLPVPDGLRELMADITREVLRYQPRNVEAFIAEYLEAMLMTREMFLIADDTVEDILDSSQNILQILERKGVSPEKAKSAVNVIREEFQRHFKEIDEDEPLKELDIINRLINECKLTVDQAEKASEILEDAWTHYYRRNKLHRSRVFPEITRHDAVRSTLNIYKKSEKIKTEGMSKIAEVGFAFDIENSRNSNWRSPNFQNRENAAKKIQSWYRELKNRKQLNEMVKAATKIQANFRGYMERKKLKAMRRFSEAPRRKPCEDGEFWRSPCFKAREDAATKIQALYRAHKLRREFNIKKQAAIVIQTHFRNFLKRSKKSTN